MKIGEKTKENNQPSTLRNVVGITAGAANALGIFTKDKIVEGAKDRKI